MSQENSAAAALNGAGAITLPARRQRAASTPRVEFVYTLRGMTMFWIVLDHSVRWAEQAIGPLTARTPFGIVDDITEGTRLPVLMFLAAIFTEAQLKRGLPDFLAKRVQYLVWPWLLWTTVCILVLATGTALGIGLSVTSFSELPQILWRPHYPTWFLYDLVAFNLVFLALRTVDRRWVLAFAFVLFGVSLYYEPLPGGDDMATRAVRHVGRMFVFFWLGIMLPGWVLSRRIDRQRSLLIGSAASLLLLTLPPVLLDWTYWRSFVLFSGLPAIPVMLWIAPRLDGLPGPFKRAFAWAGRASLQILCLHFVLAWSVVLACRAVGLVDELAIGFIATGIAIILCWWLDGITQRTGIAPWLGFGLRT